jgi:hypothetical protein
MLDNKIEKIKEFIEWLKKNPNHDIEIDMYSKGEATFNPKGTPMEEFLCKGDESIFLDYDEVLKAIGLIQEFQMMNLNQHLKIKI